MSESLPADVQEALATADAHIARINAVNEPDEAKEDEPDGTPGN